MTLMFLNGPMMGKKILNEFAPPVYKAYAPDGQTQDISSTGCAVTLERRIVIYKRININGQTAEYRSDSG